MSSSDGLAELLAKSGMSAPSQISPVAPASPHLSLSSPLHSTEYVDGFLQVLQWLQLADLRWMSAVSKHWLETCEQHCAGLQAIQSKDVMPRPPESHHQHPAPEGMHGFGFWVPSVHFDGQKSWGSFKCECGHAHISADSLPKYPQGCKHCEAETFPCCLWYNDYDFWQESEPVTWRRLDVLHWSIRHATHTALTRIDVGSSLPFGWRLPRRLISSLSTECVSLQHLCLQGMHVPQDDFWGQGVADAEYTYNALQQLQHLKHLLAINLTFCLQVDAAVLPRLRQLLPGVEIRRLPLWYLRGGGQDGGMHVCVARPGIEPGAPSAFEVGERHTYTHEGVFVYDPRERFSSGVVNRCWPLPNGLVLELEFDLEVAQYRPQVRIEMCSEEYALRHVSSSAAPPQLSRILFTSAHSTNTLDVPPCTPPASDENAIVGIWSIQEVSTAC